MKYCHTHYGMFDEQKGCIYCDTTKAYNKPDPNKWVHQKDLVFQLVDQKGNPVDNPIPAVVGHFGTYSLLTASFKPSTSYQTTGFVIQDSANTKHYLYNFQLQVVQEGVTVSLRATIPVEGKDQTVI